MRASQHQGGKPDLITLLGFGAVVLLAGSNFVGVRFSNRGLPPFYGAAIRFLAASILLFGYMFVRRIPGPSKGEWKGTLTFGVLGFFAFYAFGYWALVELPSSVGSIVTASVPLITVLFASIQRVEPFTTRGLVGSTIALVGIGVVVGAPTSTQVSVAALLAVIAAAISDAEAGILLKKFPTGHPVSTNAIAMLTGAFLLLGLSRFAGERWIIPRDRVTLTALAYLVLLGSIVLFILYVWTIKRWTASGMSYMFVLMPIVASVLGAWLADEAVSLPIVIGGLIILAGVYIGALSGKQPSSLEVAAETGPT